MNVLRRYLDRAELFVTTLAIFSIVGLIFVGVVLRYGFQSGLFWGEEIANVIFIAMSYLAISRADAMGMHFRVTILHDNLPRARPYLEVIVNAIQFALLLFLTYLAASLTGFIMDVEQRLPASSLPAFVFYVPIVVGLFLGAVRSLEKLVRGVAALLRGG